MTDSEIEVLPFRQSEIQDWSSRSSRHTNWPIVYVLDGPGSVGPNPAVYVGESSNAAKRFAQHLARGRDTNDGLDTIRVLIGRTFNKSVCHDLESHLIRLFAGDGKYQVLNRNDGIVDSDYFDRTRYRESFAEIFDQLLQDGLLSERPEQIVNSDLFKLSPFKALTVDQAVVVEDITEGLLSDIETGTGGTSVIEGAPGTGKTIVAIFLLKLLKDVAQRRSGDEIEQESAFDEFFQEGNAELLVGRRLGFVIPQQSLRASVKSVFKRTPGLDQGMVLSPFDAGQSAQRYDLLVVDETHRLSQRANQASGPLNKKFREITESLFGFDDTERSQIDWIKAQSDRQIFLADGAQSVRPADVPERDLRDLIDSARTDGRYYRLLSQMRVGADGDYVGFIRRLLAPGFRSVHDAELLPGFSDYDFRLYDDISDMKSDLLCLDDHLGLCRMVAGFAWPWVSKRNPDTPDIVIGDEKMFWNRTATDWINSATSRDEVGSIHTVQGYDLNYAAVIIGPDLTYDWNLGCLRPVKDRYFDKKGKESVPRLGKLYTEENLLRFITNAYSVLLTRGMRGTFVYVCDPDLRRYVARYLPSSAR